MHLVAESVYVQRNRIRKAVCYYKEMTNALSTHVSIMFHVCSNYLWRIDCNQIGGIPEYSIKSRDLIFILHKYL